MGYRISVDTGGTFTDVMVMDADGTPTIAKALTTHARIFDGMKEAIANAAVELGFTTEHLLADTDLLIYGTTRATNAIVTRRTAKTAFLTTEGFPDTLIFKFGGKFNPHDFTQDFPPPYIPRRYTFEIAERMSSEGEATTPLDEAQAREVLETLKQRGFEAIAVSFLWSIANPAHEIRIGQLIEEILPGVPYTLSHQLVPIVREYRRASATAIDASLKPLMQEHLRGLEADLRAAGYKNDILVSTAMGGCMHVAELIEAPIHTVKSGPAMAPIAGRTYAGAERLGDNVVICDTGGTTFDVGLVRDGRVTMTRDGWLGGQFTGHLLGVASVDVRSVGAGGGSIAWIDPGGLMRVGPQSAGSEPGPACYGRGGTEPTVSDAAAVLGYFDPEFFLGGRMKLDVNAARRAVESVASRINRPVEVAAFDIMNLASELMMRAIQEITVVEGVNPREGVLVAGGGAAGLNILPIARELGCERVILPKVASVLSAAGMQYADIIKEESANLVTTSAHFDVEGVNRTLSRLEAELKRFLVDLGPEAASRARIEFIAEARYAGQVWELDAPLPFERVHGPRDVEALVEAFHQVHERVFAVRDTGSPVEVITWRGRATVHLVPPDPSCPPFDVQDIAQVPATRACYFGTAEPVRTPIYKGDTIPAGGRITGPAIIEEPTTTLVVYPGMTATVSGGGNYLLDPKP